jgi:hypothetical protein
MAFTRFKYDNSRTIKELQQSTDPGRWVLNVPGNGTKPHYMEDPNIRIQKWGGNLMTNHIDIENSLRGITINNNKDCVDQSTYKKHVKSSEKIYYPTNSDLYVDQSRSTHPAWEYRTKESTNWLEPLQSVEEIQMIPHQSHQINTRNLEKDAYDRRNN